MLHKTIPENAEAKRAFPTILPVKAKIAADKIKHEREFIQGYCNRGESPDLSLSSIPLK